MGKSNYEAILDIDRIPLKDTLRTDILKGLRGVADAAIRSGNAAPAGDSTTWYPDTTGYFSRAGTGGESVFNTGLAIARIADVLSNADQSDRVAFPGGDFTFNNAKFSTDGKDQENRDAGALLLERINELETAMKSDALFMAACALMWFGTGTAGQVKPANNDLLKVDDKTQPYAFYNAAFHVPRIVGSIKGYRTITDILAPLRDNLAQAQKDRQSASRSAGKPSSSGGAPAGGGGGGTGAPPPAPSAPSETLAQFLDKHKDKTSGKPDVKAFAQAIINRSTNAGGSARYKDYSGAIADPLRPVAASGAGSWGGATIEDRSFDGSEGGLRDFLAFAWAATRTGGEVGADVAQSMGIEPRTEGNFAQNPDWILLGKMGAISPFRFMAIYKPAGVEQIPEGAKLSVGRLEAETTAEHKNGFFLNIGVTDYTEATGFYGDDAKALLGLSDPQKWTLKFGGKSWTAQNAIKHGAKITTDEWISSEAPAEAEGPPTAAELSGAISVRNAQITREGTTTGGDRTFDLQNMLSTPKGAGVSNIVSVTLEKRIVFTGDRWTLRVNNPGNYAILIPIRLKQPLSEAAPHWVKSFTGTSSTRPAFAYFPTSMIEWVYDKKFYKYGPTSPRIVRIDYEPSDIDIEVLKGEFKEKGITVISIDEAKRSGTASGEFDTIESAIANYISLSDQKNPVGVALYLTSNLNGQMNSYQKRTYKFG